MERAQSSSLEMQQGVFVRILTPSESYYQVQFGRGQWVTNSTPFYDRRRAEDEALIIMTEKHSREKDEPQEVAIFENNKIIRRWTKLDVDTWKEWPIDGKT